MHYFEAAGLDRAETGAASGRKTTGRKPPGQTPQGLAIPAHRFLAFAGRSNDCGVSNHVDRSGISDVALQCSAIYASPWNLALGRSMRRPVGTARGTRALGDEEDDHAFCGPPRRRPIRFVLFAVGDCVFLALVGVAAVEASRVVHQLEWGLVVTCVLSMGAAMVLQALLAFCAAPILGSIECMVPSMVVAMVGSMSVCACHMAGYEFGFLGSLGLGAAFGMSMFLLIEAYGAVCRKLTRRVFPSR